MRFRKYTVTWPCERCHADANDAVILCATADCSVTHFFTVRCDCDQRARFKYSDHQNTIAGTDTTIFPTPLLPEVH